jgi:hypothetical protein
MGKKLHEPEVSDRTTTREAQEAIWDSDVLVFFREKRMLGDQDILSQFLARATLARAT